MGSKGHKENPKAAQPQPRAQRRTQPQLQTNLADDKEDSLDQVFEARQARIRHLLAPRNRGNNVVIGSRREYLAMEAAYKSLSNKSIKDKGGDYMNGFPATDADWLARVAELTAAIRDFSDTLDNPINNATNDKTNTAVRAVQSLSTIELQLLACKILDNASDAHRGLYNFPSWPKVWKKDNYTDFNGRFQSVCRALKHSKALVKSVMDAEFNYTMRLAVAPNSELKVKDNNGKLNRKRAAITDEIKKKIRKRARSENYGGGDGEDGESGNGDATPE
jgi:hypothetical protein